MSATHRGSITVRRREDGLYEYTGTSRDYAVTDWTLPETAQNVQAVIPPQRGGNAYETVVLDTDGGEQQ